MTGRMKTCAGTRLDELQRADSDLWARSEASCRTMVGTRPDNTAPEVALRRELRTPRR